jgi:hypothetical protein
MDEWRECLAAPSNAGASRTGPATVTAGTLRAKVLAVTVGARVLTHQGWPWHGTPPSRFALGGVPCESHHTDSWQPRWSRAKCRSWSSSGVRAGRGDPSAIGRTGSITRLPTRRFACSSVRRRPGPLLQAARHVLRAACCMLHAACGTAHPTPEGHRRPRNPQR